MRSPTSSRSTARPRAAATPGPRASDPLHLVSAWASRQRLVLGQQAVAEKSNEIKAIPLLLERLDLTGALVTIDAMGAKTGSPRPSSPAAATTCSRSRPTGPPVRDVEPTSGRRRHRPLRDRRRRPRPHRDPPPRRQPRRGLAVRGPRRPGRAPLPRPRHDRHGRGRSRATARPRGAALLPVLGPARRPDLRSRRARSLGHREPPALGAGRGPSRRPRPAQDRQRSGQHGNAIRHIALNLAQRDRQKASLKIRRKTPGWDDDYLHAVTRPPRK